MNNSPPARVVAADLLPKCTFPPPGEKLVCAVSGGPDSLALLILAVCAECDVTAVHVDHGLRKGSAAEAGVVEAAAELLGAAFESRRVEIAAGPNLEARARDARRSVVPVGAATGHTMDDQAETVIINFLRGAALDGLAGMSQGPSHPILGIRRHDAVALCTTNGLEPVLDASNRDMRFLRNRVRHELLPLLCDLAGRDIVPVLARQSNVMASERDLLDDLASELDPTDATDIREAPRPLARRAVRKWLQGSAEHPPDFAGVERVLAVAAGSVRSTEVVPGVRVSRSGGRLSASDILSGL